MFDRKGYVGVKWRNWKREARACCPPPPVQSNQTERKQKKGKCVDLRLTSCADLHHLGSLTFTRVAYGLTFGILTVRELLVRAQPERNWMSSCYKHIRHQLLPAAKVTLSNKIFATCSQQLCDHLQHLWCATSDCCCQRSFQLKNEFFLTTVATGIKEFYLTI